MTILWAAVVLAVVVSLSGSSITSAADAPTGAAPAGMVIQAEPDATVDDNEDTRVEVQLWVLGIVIAVVVGVGLAAYLLRLKLGLVAGPPDQPDASHH